MRGCLETGDDVLSISAHPRPAPPVSLCGHRVLAPVSAPRRLCPRVTPMAFYSLSQHALNTMLECRQRQCAFKAWRYMLLIGRGFIGAVPEVLIIVQSRH